jgi:phosphoserine phosphatase
MRRREVEEIKEVEEVRERSGSVAAFFDLDGTLLALPSLERRFLGALWRRGRIGAASGLAWLREAARLLPRGVGYAVNGNKAYLRGIPATEAEALPIPAFFREALRQVMWHAEQGHQVVILSGTIEPLALGAARLVMEQLAARGIPARVEVSATKLELAAGSWTGRIVGEAMFGEAKARAARRFCAAQRIAAAECFAYGDSTNDRWMLEAVGRPRAVNPADDLARIARRNGWPILRWTPATSGNASFQDAGKSWGGGSAEIAETEFAGAERECWRGTE